MKKKPGNYSKILLLIILFAMVGVVVFILVDRAQYSDLIYRESTYYKEQNGNYN